MRSLILALLISSGGHSFLISPTHTYQFVPAAARKLGRRRVALFAVSRSQGFSDDSREFPTMRLVGESLERRTYIYEATLKSPLGIKLAESPLEKEEGGNSNCVVVCEVDPSSSAGAAGVRPGDRLVATGANWGGGMWTTTTVDGVTAAVQSRLRLYGQVLIRFERPFDNADEVSWRSVVSETSVVELRKPLGITLEERGEGSERSVHVKALDPLGAAAASGKIAVGDRVMSVSASVGDGMWEARSIDGFVSAVATRLSGPVRLKVEKKVRVGSWQGYEGSGEGLGTPLGLLEQLTELDASTESTRAVLLERCCALVYRYGAEKGGALKVAQVAETILSRKVKPNNKFTNMAMVGLLRHQEQSQAVALYDACVAAGVVPNLQVSTTLARALTRDKKAPRWPSKSPEPEKRLTDAMAKLQKLKVVPDTYFLNQVLRCYMSHGLVREAEDVFYRVMKAGGASAKEEKARPCAPDVASFNIMINGYAALGLASKAKTCFDDLASLAEAYSSKELQPDKFSYTGLVKALVKSGDLSSAMEVVSSQACTEGGADVFLYNTLVGGLCRQLMWREAEALVNQMKTLTPNLQPNYDTYAVLVPCLTRALHPELAVLKIEEMKALGVPLDTVMYTQLITAFARLGDPVGALGLLKEMRSQGLAPSLRAYTAAMDACLRSGNPDTALALSAEMKKSTGVDDVVYSMMVKAYGLKGEVRKAALLVASMQREFTQDPVANRSVRPTKVVYNALLSEATKAQAFAIALGTLDEILLIGRPDEASYEALASEPKDRDRKGAGERSAFLFQAVRRVAEMTWDTGFGTSVRMTGSLYSTCLTVALAEGTPEATEQATALISARRRGEVRVRQRDERICVAAERAWERRLGRVFEGAEWEVVKLFDSSEAS
mmetsp:Transcript_28153/g.62820  ORF Transcript_28153/g.62820 Transcript_28153/m.62820 type:complete len:894 (+) Transcript_28153:136-2817(+)